MCYSYSILWKRSAHFFKHYLCMVYGGFSFRLVYFRKWNSSSNLKNSSQEENQTCLSEVKSDREIRPKQDFPCSDGWRWPRRNHDRGLPRGSSSKRSAGMTNQSGPGMPLSREVSWSVVDSRTLACDSYQQSPSFTAKPINKSPKVFAFLGDPLSFGFYW